MSSLPPRPSGGGPSPAARPDGAGVPPASLPPSGHGALPAGVWVLGFVSLLMDLSSEMVHALLPLYLVGSLGMSVLAVGVLEGAAEATALVVRVFSGALSDAVGRRKPLVVAGYAMGALAKPLFALAGSAGVVVAARLFDRLGKGIRGAPRDALLADLAPPARRGEAFGLRQSLDTVGAFAGPLAAVALMWWWDGDIRAVFWAAAVPAAAAVALLVVGLREDGATRTSSRAAAVTDGADPDTAPAPRRRRFVNPIRRDALARLPRAYWHTVAVGALFALARLSEAFLVLRAQQLGIKATWVPLVMVAMNAVYAASAYPFGRLSDRVAPRTLLAAGLLVLAAADLVLARADGWPLLLAGVALWGLHMGLTQGLLSALVAAHAPAELRGTAFGVFHLAGGVALLASGAGAGWLWERYGAAATFDVAAGVAGVAVAALAMAALRARAGRARAPR